MPKRMYIHPDSPATGEQWMQKVDIDNFTSWRTVDVDCRCEKFFWNSRGNPGIEEEVAKGAYILHSGDFLTSSGQAGQIPPPQHFFSTNLKCQKNVVIFYF